MPRPPHTVPRDWLVLLPEASSPTLPALLPIAQKPLLHLSAFPTSVHLVTRSSSTDEPQPPDKIAAWDEKALSPGPAKAGPLVWPPETCCGWKPLPEKGLRTGVCT